MPSDGQLSFQWLVSSEAGWDYLTFYINGVQQDAISGEADWNQENYTVHAGDTLRWEYSKDGGDSDGMDAGFLDQVSYIPNNSQNFNAALGTQNWNWTLSGDSHWSVENTNTHDSYFAAQSGRSPAANIQVANNGDRSRHLEFLVDDDGRLRRLWFGICH
ncbi:MAG: hypothetical protein WDM76_13135 [Limisphaerales bacterium]